MNLSRHVWILTQDWCNLLINGWKTANGQQAFYKISAEARRTSSKRYLSPGRRRLTEWYVTQFWTIGMSLLATLYSRLFIEVLSFSCILIFRGFLGVFLHIHSWPICHRTTTEYFSKIFISTFELFKVWEFLSLNILPFCIYFHSRH